MTSGEGSGVNLGQAGFMFCRQAHTIIVFGHGLEQTPVEQLYLDPDRAKRRVHLLKLALGFITVDGDDAQAEGGGFRQDDICQGGFILAKARERARPARVARGL